MYKGRDILDIIEQELDVVDGSPPSLTDVSPSKRRPDPSQTLSQRSASPYRYTSIDVERQNEYLRKVQNEIDAGAQDVAFRVETNVKVSNITGKGFRRSRLV